MVVERRIVQEFLEPDSRPKGMEMRKTPKALPACHKP